MQARSKAYQTLAAAEGGRAPSPAEFLIEKHRQNKKRARKALIVAIIALVLGALVAIGAFTWLGLLQKDVDNLEADVCTQGAPTYAVNLNFLSYNESTTSAESVITTTFAYLFRDPPTNTELTDDGNVSFVPGRGLEIDSSPFASRSTGVFDHTKYVVLTQDSVAAVADNSEVFVEASVSGDITGVLLQPGQLTPGMGKYALSLVDAPADPRPACMVLTMADVENAMNYDIVVTNTSIYALYEHQPFNDVTGNFTYMLFQVQRPGNTSEPVNLRLAYNRARQTVTYSVNGFTYYTLANLGLPIAPERLVNNGGLEGSSRIDSLSMQGGFGTFSFLDFTPANGPTDGTKALADIPTTANRYQRYPDYTGYPFPLTYQYSGTQNVDGQGATMYLQNFKLGKTSAPCAA